MRQPRKRLFTALLSAVMLLATVGGYLPSVRASSQSATYSTGENTTVKSTTSVPDYAWRGSSAFVAQMKNVASGGKVVSTGKTYYVAKNGSNSNAGTKEKPLKTIKAGLKKLKAGDTLIIRKGTYQEYTSLTASGTSTNYITVKNYPNEKVTLKGDGSDREKTLLSISGHYINVEGLNFTEMNGSGAAGIYVRSGAHDVILQGLNFSNIKVSGYDNGANAIIMYGNSTSQEIRDIMVYDCVAQNCKTGSSEAFSVMGNCRRVNIVRNTVKKINNMGICLYGNYGYCKKKSVDFPRDCLVAGNLVTDCKASYSTSAGIYVDGGQNITIQSNQVLRCGCGIEIGSERNPSSKYRVKNIKVLNNTVKDNKEVGMAVGGYSSGCGTVSNVTFKNNLCLENGLKEGELLAITKCTDIIVENNAFISKKAKGSATIVNAHMGSSLTKRLHFKNNVYYNGKNANNTIFCYIGHNYYTFSKWKKASKDSGSVYSSKTTIKGADKTGALHSA